MRSQKKTVGIVGGGILGMTLALRLSQRGFKVTLMEASESLGGLASPLRIGPFTWDQFYHVMLLSDSNLLGLIDELQLSAQIRWGQTKTGFYTDGRFCSMSNVFEFLTFPPLGLADKIRLGWTIFYASRIKAWKHLEAMPVAEWLKRHSGEKTYEKIWLPLLKSKLGDNHRIVNAAFIWASIARTYAARRAGLKQEMFGYVDGGCAAILERFQARLNDLGIKTILGVQVSTAAKNGAGIDIWTGNKFTLHLDALIFTLPCPYVVNICANLSSPEKLRLQNVKYQGVICLALILRKPLAGFYVTNITDPGIPFTAVIEMTSLVDKKYFDGNSLIYLPLYLANNDPFWGMDDHQIEAIFLKGLETMYPSLKRDDILYTKVARGSHVMPITTLSYSSDLVPPTRTSLDNVFIVNSAQIANGTMNINEIVGLANRKAEEITKFLMA